MCVSVLKIQFQNRQISKSSSVIALEYHSNDRKNGAQWHQI